MGKSARVLNARLVELRAQQAKAERRSKLVIAGRLSLSWPSWSSRWSSPRCREARTITGQSATALDQATFAKLTSVPVTALDTVGVGTSDNAPKTIDAPALTKDARPRVLYGRRVLPLLRDGALAPRRRLVAIRHCGTTSAAFSAPAPE